MTLEEKDPLWEQSASYLRTLLSSEIQDFIRSIESKLPIDELTRKRDRIRSMYAILSPKENAEFEKVVGKYFYTIQGDPSGDNKFGQAN